jgi:hypothetical protein
MVYSEALFIPVTPASRFTCSHDFMLAEELSHAAAGELTADRPIVQSVALHSLGWVAVISTNVPALLTGNGKDNVRSLR